MIASGMRSLDIPYLDGNIFRQVTMFWPSDIFINFVNFCMAWSGNHISRAP